MSTHGSAGAGTRGASAGATRRRIIDAATTLLLDGGYHSMSISELAAAAKVSPQTVYNAIGGKSEVVKLVYDTMLVGDDAPVAMADRPEFRALSAATDHDEFMRAYARLSGVIYDRVGRLLGVLLAEGAGSDPGLRDFVRTIDAERRAGNTNALKAMETSLGLPDALAADPFVDEVWCLTAPEVYDRLVRRCRWSHEAYTHWLEEVLVEALRRHCRSPRAMP